MGSLAPVRQRRRRRRQRSYDANCEASPSQPRLTVGDGVQSRNFNVLDSLETCSPRPPTSRSRCNLRPCVLGTILLWLLLWYQRIPNRNSESIMNTRVVRGGVISVKEGGFVTSWVWRSKWLILREQTLSIHKNKVRLLITQNFSLTSVRPVTTQPHFCSLQASPAYGTINLRDITNVERVDLKPYCLFLETKDKRFHLSFMNDEELSRWQDDIHFRCPALDVSSPFKFVHQIHVDFDPVTRTFTVHSALFSSTRFDRAPLVSCVGYARGMARNLDTVRGHPGGLC